MIQASDEKNKLSRQPAFKLTVTLTGKVVEVIVFGIGCKYELFRRLCLSLNHRIIVNDNPDQGLQVVTSNTT